MTYRTLFYPAIYIPNKMKLTFNLLIFVWALQNKDALQNQRVYSTVWRIGIAVSARYVGKLDVEI